MDDLPNINPVRPAWHKRPDEKNPKRRNRETDSEQEQAGIDQKKQPQSDHDGEIDEYV